MIFLFLSKNTLSLSANYRYFEPSYFLISLLSSLLLLTACGSNKQQQTKQDLALNDLEYFECQGVNVLVYSNNFNGGFNDEKNSGIEIIHHGVRTVQGGAVRLNKTPEQWDLVPKTTSRTVNRDAGQIEVGLRYDDYDFDSRIVVTSLPPTEGKEGAVEIAVWLDKPVPERVPAFAILEQDLPYGWSPEPFPTLCCQPDSYTPQQ